MNDNHAVVAVFTRSGSADLSHCVGKVDLDTKRLSWGECTSTDTGAAVAVTMNSNLQVVEVYNGTRSDNLRKLYHRVGTANVATKTISFPEDGRSWDAGSKVTLSLNDQGQIVQAHNGTGRTSRRRLYYGRGSVQGARSTGVTQNVLAGG